MKATSFSNAFSRTARASIPSRISTHRKKPPWGRVNAGPSETPAHGADHGVAPHPVRVADALDVGVHVVEAQIRLHLSLAQRAGVKVRALLGDDELAQDLRRRRRPPHSKPGAEDLGEAPQEDHQPLFIHGLQAGKIVALEPQLGVGAVLQDRDGPPGDDLHEPLPPLQGPASSRGVLEVGDDVDKLRPFRFQDFLQRLGTIPSSSVGTSTNRGS